MTDNKHLETELLFYKEMIDAIQFMTDDIFWWHNLSTLEVRFSGKTVSLFDVELTMKNFPQCILERNIIFSEDVEIFLSMKKAILDGKESIFEYRMKDKTEKISWYECQYRIVSKQNEINIFGRLVNIDAKKKLQLQYQIDSLTGCYNKSTTEDKINAILKNSLPNECHAFFLIDIDNFKSINDRLGHVFGDTVLTELGDQLQNFMRKTDIVGRIGGEEFVVLIKNISNTIELKEMAQKIVDIFKMKFPGTDQTYYVSGSVGISMFNINGTTYQELYEKADIAMYSAKHAGKDQFVIYSDKITSPILNKLINVEDTIKTSFFEGKNNILIKIFQMIRKTNDIPVTINAVLKLVGKSLDVSRIGIFEFDKVNHLYYNTFEWCNENIPSEIEELQGIPLQAYSYPISQIGEEGIFACTDTTQSHEQIKRFCADKGVKSTLQNIYIENKNPLSMVFFDECRRKRAWTQEECEIIFFLNHLISPYLLKDRVSTDSDFNIKWEYYRLKEKTDFDLLTGIPSKDKFYRDTENMFQQHPDTSFLFFRFDVDNFRMINSYFGTTEGDNLLKEIANNMKTFGEKTLCTYGRIGADVFCGCYEVSKPTEEVIEIMLENMTHTIKEYSLTYQISLPVGIYKVSDLTIPVEEMYSRVVMAAKECKKHPDLKYVIYTDELMEIAVNRQALKNEMHISVEKKYFEVYLQPKVSLENGSIIGAEALARWNHPIKGYIPPDVFIPFFEENGFITTLDCYIWKEVCAFIRQQIDIGEYIVPISVNVSKVDLYNKNIERYFEEILTEYQIPVEYLHIEITESAYIDNTVEVVKTVHKLKNLGLTVEMDDFGKGYSSLGMLQELPIDVLKLDLSLIDNLGMEQKKSSIVKFVLSLAETLSIPVVAEGVETLEQINLLKSMGCDMGQGYYFSPPVSLEDFKKKIKDKQVLTIVNI